MQSVRVLMAFLSLIVLLVAGCSGNDSKSLEKVDYNKDGKIIFEELIVAFPDVTVDEFLGADGNHDGVLDQKEYQRLREARKAGKKLTAPAGASAPAMPGQPAPAEPAAPATPAATTQPAATAQPAPAGQPASPAPTPAPQEAAPDTLGASAPAQEASPATPATPAAPAAQQPAAATTPAVQPAATAPAKPANLQYVVRRGDYLSRIARKFGVSVQELMDANGMHNADHLEAGATLTIPGAAAAVKLAPPAVTAFVADVFAKSATGDVNALLDLYGKKVDYYRKGLVGQDRVRQDKVRYFSRWPKRTYKPGAATVSEPSAAGNLRVTVPVAYTLDNGRKTASGTAVFTFVLHPESASYRIVGENSIVPKRK